MAKANKVIQAELDVLKWNESKKVNKDFSGSMKYCSSCKHPVNGECRITHKQRVATSECAKAFKKA